MFGKKLQQLDDDPRVREATQEMTKREEVYRTVRQQIGKLRREVYQPTHGVIDSSGAAAARFDARYQRTMRQIDEDLVPQLNAAKQAIEEQRSQVAAVRRAVTLEVVESVADEHRQLLARQVSGILTPLADAIAAQAEIEQLHQSLLAAGHEPHHVQRLQTRPFDNFAERVSKLRSDVMELIDAGWLKAGDLPKPVAKAWGY